MPRRKQPQNSIPESVEQAWREQGEIGAVQETIVKYAKVLDMTDSGRDMKPLVSGMMEQIDRLKALEAAGAKTKGKKTTPLFKVIEDAKQAQ